MSLQNNNFAIQKLKMSAPMLADMMIKIQNEKISLMTNKRHEIEHEDLCIVYEIVDESFTHELGIKKGFALNIIKVEQYSESFNWLDITKIMNEKMRSKCEKIILDKMD